MKERTQKCMERAWIWHIDKKEKNKFDEQRNDFEGISKHLQKRS